MFIYLLFLKIIKFVNVIWPRKHPKLSIRIKMRGKTCNYFLNDWIFIFLFIYLFFLNIINFINVLWLTKYPKLNEVDNKSTIYCNFGKARSHLVACFWIHLGVRVLTQKLKHSFLINSIILICFYLLDKWWHILHNDYCWFMFWWSSSCDVIFIWCIMNIQRHNDAFLW